jgi:hypothetical protein
LGGGGGQIQSPPPVIPPKPGTLKSLMRGLQWIFAPQTLKTPGFQGRSFEQPARRTANNLRGASAEMERLAMQTDNILKAHDQTLAAMSPQLREEFIDWFQAGRPRTTQQWTPEQIRYADDLERVGLLWERAIRQLPQHMQSEFKEQYIPQQWQNPERHQLEFYKNAVAAAMRGRTGSLHQTAFPSYAIGRRAGLIPATDSPTRLFNEYAGGMKNYVAKQEVLQRGINDGTMMWGPRPKIAGATGAQTPHVTNDPPPGWVSPKSAMQDNQGRMLYMPEEVATLWDRFHDATKMPYTLEAAANVKNALTALELGLNGYHFVTMAQEGMFSDIARAFQFGAAGRLGMALKALSEAPFTPYTKYQLGKKVENFYLDPHNPDPITNVLVEKGGMQAGSAQMRSARDVNFANKNAWITRMNELPQIVSRMIDAGHADWAELKAAYPDMPRAAAMMVARQAARALKQAAYPLFNVYIPRLKNGVAYKMMEDWRALNPHKIGTAEEGEAARRIVDSVDNRFGEMNTRHMFVHKVAQNAGVLLLRSMSWQAGVAKELGGGTYALGKGAVTGKNVMSPASAAWDPRAAYVPALIIGVSAISTAYQMLMGSGDRPKGWEDLYAPRTGGTVPGVGGRGQVPEHVLLPGYQKDIHGWLIKPWTGSMTVGEGLKSEAYGKLAAPWQAGYDILSNRDYRNAPIANPKGSFLQQLGDRLGYLLSKSMPISVKSFLQPEEPTTRIPAPMRAVGFRATGSDINAPEQLRRALDAIAEREWKAKVRRENIAAQRQGAPQPLQ